MAIITWLFLFVNSFLLLSCETAEEKSLRERVNKKIIVQKESIPKSHGAIMQYIQQEKQYNQEYTHKVKSLIEKRFDNQLKQFEEEELGVIKGYQNMLSWLFSSTQEWEDKQLLLANKYFNNIDISQDLHELYLTYAYDINKLRMQFTNQSSTHLEKYDEIPIPQEEFVLNLSEHTKNNIIIEIGAEALQWLLTFAIVQLILLFVDKIVGPWGCIIDLIVLIIVIAASIIITSYNDNKILNEIREQYVNNDFSIDSHQMLNKLNQNTISFYENK